MYNDQDLINAVGGMSSNIGGVNMQPSSITQPPSSAPFGSDPTSMNPNYLSAFGQMSGNNPMFNSQPFSPGQPQMGMSGQHHAIGGGGWNSYTHGGPHDIIQALMQMGGNNRGTM